MRIQFIVLLLIVIIGLTAASAPLVTLPHQGQLRGKAIAYKNGTVDVFLGVPYAKPPVGSLRFKKSQKADSWTGVRDALKFGNMCTQKYYSKPGKIIGSEDCLYLNVWVPSNSTPSSKHPVMVWIHGGGYVFGSGQQMLFPYPYEAGIIMVSINYRLGMFGFLNDGSPSSGNFGLWDQRQAFIWVQENIAAFGGDAGKVTIFGESAGGGSVNCQSLSLQNNNLFHRVIQQSGTCFAWWGLSPSSQDIRAESENMREYLKCDCQLYDCFKDMSSEKVMEVYTNTLARRESVNINPFLVPHPDDDFFRSDYMYNGSWAAQNRFDYIAGFNGQEAMGMLWIDSMNVFQGTNLTLIKDGIPEGYMNQFLLRPAICGVFVGSKAQDSCVNSMIEIYELNNITDNKNSAYKMSIAASELTFDVDAFLEANQSHMSHNYTTKIYGYHLTVNKQPEGGLSWPTPRWLKKSAGHGEDLIYVFKFLDFKENFEMLEKEVYGPEFENLKNMSLAAIVIPKIDESYRNLTEIMFKAWANFAISGNPNYPMNYTGAPEWVPFRHTSSGNGTRMLNHDKLMELNEQPRMVDFPYSKRLTRVRDLIRTPYEKYRSDGRHLRDTGKDKCISGSASLNYGTTILMISVIFTMSARKY